MNKKTVVAFYVDTNENIIKTWTCRVSRDIEMSDVIVHKNTLFSFFSMYDEAEFEVIQIKLFNNLTVDMSILRKYISDNKIYCHGKNKNGSLVVIDSGYRFTLSNFIEQTLIQGINIEYI